MCDINKMRLCAYERARMRACLYEESFRLLSRDVERSFSFKLTVTVWMYLVNTRDVWLTSTFVGY